MTIKLMTVEHNMNPIKLITMEKHRNPIKLIAMENHRNPIKVITMENHRNPIMEINQLCISCVRLRTFKHMSVFFIFLAEPKIQFISFFLYELTAFHFFILALHHNAVLSPFLWVKDCIISPRSLMRRMFIFYCVKL